MSDKPVCELMAPDVNGDQLLLFHCPGCGMAHGPRVIGTRPGASWTWNGDTGRPTLSPSIRVQWYQMSDEGEAMLSRGESPADGERYPGRDMLCHSFVRDGRIEFLSDCTHALAGQTVPLEPIE